MIVAGKIIEYNSQEFRSLFERLFPAICLLAGRILKDDAKGKDVAQEAFVKLLNKANEEFTDENALRAYLYILVKNACISIIRKEKKILNTPVDDGMLIAEQSFLNEVLREETYQLLREAIKDLSPQAARVVDLTLKGYSNLDISDEMGITINTVKTTKRRAYQSLRKNLGHQFVMLLLTNFIRFF
ncbi:RNA polymerase sigma factor [Flavobacterium granuli]|uniref:RNA polymerase sigma factor (Sigma-70 family) n=1 Tax=Flavobacterium granuli TaxID=280093 RepID=A0A1M5S8S4_9FLAO|nr:RNA polymerase sigma factor [Flavobacterium granuli]PRZ21248.1 RNA polymerase sigma factor (sigma-70 family) [Flavobacterium granuli]SHH34850.1 RNA polymerase sigma factor, sigma-70 family [Flavobacterium granuli]